MSRTSLLILIGAAALGTYLLRASFLSLVASERLPLWAKRGLRYVPPAVLAALAVPAFVPAAWPPDGAGSLVRPAAAVVAVLMGWRFGSVLLTIGSGMATLWLLKLVL